MYGKLFDFHKLSYRKAKLIIDIIKNIQRFVRDNKHNVIDTNIIKQYVSINKLYHYINDLVIDHIIDGRLRILSVSDLQPKKSNCIHFGIQIIFNTKYRHITNDIFNDDYTVMVLIWNSPVRCYFDCLTYMSKGKDSSKFVQTGIHKKEIDIYEKRERKKQRKLNHKHTYIKNRDKSYTISRNLKLLDRATTIEERQMFNGAKSVLRAKDRKHQKFGCY